MIENIRILVAAQRVSVPNFQTFPRIISKLIVIAVSSVLVGAWWWWWLTDYLYLLAPSGVLWLWII